MLKAKPAKEVVVKVRNEIGVLAQISSILANRGLNILAASAWVNGADALVHLVTDDNLRAVDALRAKNYSPRESDAVLTEAPHRPGMLRNITETLAKEGLDIHHLYASAAADQTKSLVVFSCANNDRAIVLLNQ